MKETLFAFTVGYIRSLENKLLSDEVLNMLRESLDFTDFIDKLISSGYKIKMATSFEDFSLQLDNNFKLICDFIKKSCPNDTPFNWLWLKNDTFNYKAVLKSIFSNSNWHDLIVTPSNIDSKLMEDCIKSQSFTKMPEYFKELAKNSVDILSKTNDGNKAEIYIDKTMFKVMLHLSRTDEFLLKRTMLNITLENLVICIRCIMANKNLDDVQNYLIDGGEISTDKILKALMDGISGITSLIKEYDTIKNAEEINNNPMHIEKWKVNKLIEFDKASSSYAFGFSPIVAYIKNLQKEHRILREIAILIQWNGYKQN